MVFFPMAFFNNRRVSMFLRRSLDVFFAGLTPKAPKTLAGSANFMQPGGAAEGLQEVGAGA